MEQQIFEGKRHGVHPQNEILVFPLLFFNELSYGYLRFEGNGKNPLERQGKKSALLAVQKNYVLYVLCTLMMFHHIMVVMNHSSRFSDVSKFLMILNETSSILTSTNQKNNMSHRPTLITPSIPELIWVKKVRAIVVCGFLMK